MPPPTIALASDHAGFRYKEALKSALGRRGLEVVDFGTDSDRPVDYPDFVRPAAEAVASGRCARAVVLGGSGNGEAMVANKVPGVRCAVAWNLESARLASAHNDANVLSMGERMIPDAEAAIAIVAAWLETPFEEGRHRLRIDKIEPQPATNPDR